MDWSYDAWPSGAPYDWHPAGRGDSRYDQVDFHLDLGCGRIKKGRIGVDRHAGPGVDLELDFDSPNFWLPMSAGTVESIIAHHSLEHVGEGLLRLMDECYRVLVPDGLFRIVVPLFPSHAAVADPDHRRYFVEGGFDAFLGRPDLPFWSDSFAAPYTSARFQKLDESLHGELPADPHDVFRPGCARELRVALAASK